ncbi:MAG: FecR domain-containing protein [Pedobacter sp.]|uniref:FecR domain-containing protein n=1 Tax=Pedobacter sp. TaxID=1411316 RepID=UPI0035645E8B
MDKNAENLDWDQLLQALEQDHSVGKTLTHVELELLEELRGIKGETAELLQGYRNFDTSTELARAKARIYPVDHSIAVEPIRRKINIWPRLASVAAAVLLVIGAGLFYFTNSGRPGNEIQPGANKAYLTLANGQKISLNDAGSGQLAKEAGVEITKTADGQIIYSISSDTQHHTDLVNTIETPKGGQYQLRLPDGSRVWLNAESKLIYPVSFAKRGRREVNLTGEAYFEISKDKKHPFIVKSADQEVAVLGTNFNLSSYPNETVTKTTLLEGVVQVANHSNKTVVLKPGQQAVVDREHLLEIQVREVKDLEMAIAWKNGNFYFVNESLEGVMKKIARWYDLEVIFQGNAGEIRMGGVISRKVVLSQVLELLEETTSCDFEVEGRKVLIRKKN